MRMACEISSVGMQRGATGRRHRGSRAGHCPSLDNLLRYVGKIESRQACHAASFAAGWRAASAADADFRIGDPLGSSSANPPEVNLTPFPATVVARGRARVHAGEAAGGRGGAGGAGAVQEDAGEVGVDARK